MLALATLPADAHRLSWMHHQGLLHDLVWEVPSPSSFESSSALINTSDGMQPLHWNVHVDRLHGKSGYAITPVANVTPAEPVTMVWETSLNKGAWEDVWNVHKLRRVRDIGIGTGGRVMLLEDTSSSKRSYAGKFIPFGQWWSEGEVRLQKRVQSNPHIVKIVNHKKLDNVGEVIVMEFLPNEHLLRKIILGDGLQPPYDIQRTFRQLVEAVRHMHEKGIAHCDVKLENVFCREGRLGTPPVVKIGDFGFAVEFDTNPESLPSITQRKGTPDYTPPEVWRAHNHPYRGPERDVWSLGVTLYMMLAGQRPWTGTSVHDLAIRICTEPYPRLPPTVSSQAKSLVARMLAKDVSKRFTIQQVANHPAMKPHHMMKSKNIFKRMAHNVASVFKQ